MKITNLETYTVDVPLQHVHVTSQDVTESIPHVFVRLLTDEGIAGIGEVTVLPNLSNEEAVTIEYILNQVVNSVVVGTDPLDFQQTMDKVDRKIGISPRLALEMALYDTVGKALNTPLYNFLGGKVRDRAVIAVSIDSGNLESDIDLAKIAVEKSEFKILNVKVGQTSPPIDVERIGALRKAVGQDILIRCDANMAYTPRQAIRVIRKMERYDIDHFEQPVIWWNIKGMADVARAVDTPIMADESVGTPQDALNIIENQAAEWFLVKTVKKRAAGISNAKSILNIAEAAGIKCLMGTMNASTIGTAAILNLIASSRSIQEGCHVGGPSKYDMAMRPLEQEKNVILVPEGPGLGVEVDLGKMQKLSKKSQHAQSSRLRNIHGDCASNCTSN